MHLAVLTILFFSLMHTAFSQETSSEKRDLYVYGSSIASSDASKFKVSADLFYSQFQLSNSFNLHDMRSTVYTQEVLEEHKESDDIVFYNKIVEDDSMWLTSLHLIDFLSNEEVQVEYKYNEYYRILIDAKDTLNDLLQKYESNTDKPEEYAQSTSSSEEDVGSVTIANLFGTWYGEEHIDKIVILRGGKGFVIFENGASMNISVSVDGNSFFAKQESKSNASFFPELPREVALVKALDGSLIEWELTIDNENSLTGVKHTFGEGRDPNGQTVAVKEEIPVKWYR